MNIRGYMISVLVFLAAQPSMAQTLIPATSEDISAFDRQVGEQLKKAKTDKNKSNFGSEVSSEAKKLSESASDQGREFGQWVSSQRKKEDQGRPSAQGSANADNAGKSAERGSSTGKGKKK